MGSNSSSSSSSPNPKKLKFRLSLLLCFLFLFLNIPTATAFFRNPFRKPEISYSQHCNDVVPEPPLSFDNVPVSHSNDFLSFQFAFFSGGVGIFNRTSESGISLSFNPSYIKNTTSHGVHKVKATLNIRDPWKQSVFGRRRLISIRYREDDSVFSVNGYWSESSGKLCMVGSGKSYVGSFSSKYPDVVLKLNYSKNISIYGSLIGGTLECLHMKNDYNYFEPIVILGLSQNPDYEYAKVDKSDCLSAQKGGGDINLSQSKLDRGVCFFFDDRTSLHELEYWSDCSSVNCNPLRGSIEYLPYYIAYRGVRCDQRSRKVQLLLGFPNPNDMESDFPGPNATLIAEGAWDENENKFCGVACRILANASVGDCEIGFSLRFPAVMSLRNWGSMVGEIWSKKDVKDSGYFGRFGFQNWVGAIDPQGLRYEYTKIEAVRNSCAQGKEIVRGTGKSYPDGFSLDMGFGLLVRNTEGKVASGFLRPQFVGDVIYVHQDELKSNHSRMLNMSYKITFLFEADSLSKLVIISAEGIYDRDIGLLCMIGCRHLDFESHDRNSIKNGSVDCETRITVQFPPLHAEQAEIAKGTIESRRSKSDPLYFEPLQLSSNSMTTTQAKISIWKMNLGITMVVICCGGLLFGVLFKGRCILPKRLRDSYKYEEVPVIGNDKFLNARLVSIFAADKKKKKNLLSRILTNSKVRSFLKKLAPASSLLVLVALFLPIYSQESLMADSGENQQPEQVCNFFRKPSRNKNIRKRTVDEDEEDDSKTEGSFLHSQKKTIKPDNKLYFSTGSSKNKTSTEAKEESEKPIFQFESSREIQVEHDSRATATLETETDFSRDARALRERSLKQAEEALKGKGKSSGDEKLYRGINGYTDYKAGFRREQTVASEKAGGAHGPLRASAHIRVSARFDYQPDICKDYKETGYCGYGDSCKFMHDRGDYKSGWQMEKEWDEAEKIRKRNLALGLDDEDDGGVDPGEEDDDDDSLPFACFICRQPFVDAVVTKCKHYFCEHCALKHHTKNKKCFVCNKPTLGIFNTAHEIRKRIAAEGK